MCVHVSTFLIVFLFSNEMLVRLASLNSHTRYLNAIIGLGSGVSILSLLLLTLAQIVSCIMISVPTIYNKIGTAIPSSALGGTLVIEMFVYHGFSDNELIFKACMMWISLAFIGLLRGDARTRADALDTPLYGPSVAAEASIRFCCTRIRSALVFPPLCVVIMVRALILHNFWMSSGTNYEIKRINFCSSVAFCSVFLFAAAHDRSPSQHVFSKLVRFAKQVYDSVYKRMYGRIPNGKKKVI